MSASPMPGLPFLRPYAARSLRQLAPSPRGQSAYLRFYQTACASSRRRPSVTATAPSCLVDRSRPRHGTRKYGAAVVSGESTKSAKTVEKAGEKSDEKSDDTSTMITKRIQELVDADALHHPRYASEADRISVPEFRVEFADVGLEGEEGSSDSPPGEQPLPRRVEISGRLLSVRRLGSKLVFLRLLDEGQEVQVMCNQRPLAESNADVTPAAFKALARLLRRGDHVAVSGHAMRTPTGELTLDADALPRLYSPGLAPLPTHLQDADTRALRRHLDLLVHPAGAATLRLRARILQEIRSFLEQQRFVEVQTPILSAAASGAVARPFVTTHDETQLHLRIAPELWLKRLVVGGLDRVYEIGPAFRNEGIDATHNPEFATCEFYAAYWTLPKLIAATEDLLAQLAKAAQAFRASPAGEALEARKEGEAEEQKDQEQKDQTSDKTVLRCAAGGPFVQVEFVPSLETALGFQFPDLEGSDALGQLCRLLEQHGHGDVVVAKDGSSRSLSKLLDALAGIHLEPRSTADRDGPLFITHHPAVMSPLAKSFVCPKTGQRVSARAELFVDGRELANMYEEENDPFAQRQKMTQQVLAGRAIADDETPPVDENYLTALESGLPPTGGWGCGIDRLVMLFSGAPRIADCLSFGTLRHVVSMAKQ